MNKRVIAVFGATSAIAHAAAREYAAAGSSFCLIARNQNKLETSAKDLKARGAERVETVIADFSDPDAAAASVAEMRERLPDYDTVLIAFGMLPDQLECQKSPAKTDESFQVNLLSAVSVLTETANDLERKGSGVIAAISSVAGDRGRQSNYVYGAAKAGLSVFLAGLRNRLASKGVAVVTIKPGFVDTPMTVDLKKGPLFAKPESVAKGIVRAIERPSSVVYLPWFWRFIMFIIRAIPEFIFKRLNL